MANVDSVDAGIEVPGDGPDNEVALAGPVAVAVDSIQARTALRDQRGRYVPGSIGHLQDGTRSSQLLNVLEPLKKEIVGEVLADLGADVPATLRRIVGAFGETSLLREAVFHQMLGRPTSAKGHARRLLSAYMTLVDRELRLAMAIGLNRPQNPASALPTAEQIRIALIAANVNPTADRSRR